MNRVAPADFAYGGTPRQRLRALKRLEAEARNASTPHHRRKAHRLGTGCTCQKRAT